MDIVVADSDDFNALTSLAKATNVIIAFAGPFARWFSSPCGPFNRRVGDKVVQACAENGTHYVDITGETPWYYFLCLG